MWIQLKLPHVCYETICKTWSCNHRIKIINVDSALFQTNSQFLINVLKHPKFRAGILDTSFIDENPNLCKFAALSNRAQKLLYYIGTVMVNGPQTPLATTIPPSKKMPTVPETEYGEYRCSR